ncbi:hypothetical protein ACFWXO_13790 [Kitasatospora sp. NPDC059088]|uniref:hypothetical protein n=1 Tax=Kitasatospora sp. NPDC059088 TaxID=3346722 RepID=UPI003678EBD4
MTAILPDHSTQEYIGSPDATPQAGGELPQDDQNNPVDDLIDAIAAFSEVGGKLAIELNRALSLLDTEAVANSFPTNDVLVSGDVVTVKGTAGLATIELTAIAAADLKRAVEDPDAMGDSPDEQAWQAWLGSRVESWRPLQADIADCRERAARLAAKSRGGI